MKREERASELIKAIGYFFTGGGMLGLIGYVIYRLVPQLQSLWAEPGFWLGAAIVVGVVLIVLGLIFERRAEG